MTTEREFLAGLGKLASPRSVVEQILEDAGIHINGDQPWDPQVHNQNSFSRFLAEGRLGLGESYVDGWWDCAALDEFFFRALRAGIDARSKSWRSLLPYLSARLINHQRRSKAWEIGQAHYDIGNDLFQAMLDHRMVYSCAYWHDADTLDAAQEAKLELVCRKLGIQPGMRVLDIGCGWGSFAQYAAERHRVEVVGITVSREQVELGKIRCAGLPVDLRLQDYRDLRGRFDRIVSIGMFEHVGHKNYRRFMEICHRCLGDKGLMLLHTIGGLRTAVHQDQWIAKYIFPNSLLPSARHIADAIEGRFVLEDWHNFGADYDRTLMAWSRNFDAAWPSLAPKYGERFYRIWHYYLHYCAASFRARYNHLWQIVLSKGGVPGGYTRVA